MQDNIYLLKILRVISRLLTLAGSFYIIAALVIFFMPGTYRIYAFDIQTLFSAYIPQALKGSFVYALPFGGGLRGDFILYGIGLKLLGSLLRKATR